ncbi:glutamine synthetase family protein [Streptomyces sp. NPDC001508]|uniref:glutamine synthetase family protein n=1 Tax=Streptomyces sp. NPDC001508 TaxID=3154656 RepID=UPI00331DA48D
MPEPDLVFIATNDLVGITRGKALPITPITPLDSALTTGVGWTPANLALTSSGGILSGNPFGTRGDLRLLPDPGSAADLPADEAAPAIRLYLADQVELDGTPWRYCPRGALKSVLQRLHERTGLTLTASFEHEFMLPGVTSDAPFTFGRLRAAEPFGTDLVRLLTAAGLEPENWLPEYGAGQYEITLKPTDALKAADRAVLLREIVRDLARRRGIPVTFAPVTDPSGTGNGVHIHFSLLDEHGEPVLYDANRPGGLSEVGARFAAGILQHSSAVAAWTAPSPVSYIRLAPDRWSVAGSYLAERNREALVRICPTTSLSKTPIERQFNLEYRAADATANPWLALGALVAAGLQGIEANYPPPRVWPEAMTDADVPLLPTSTQAALDALQEDDVARSWFAPELVDLHLAVRRADAAEVDNLELSARCERIADVY